MIKSSRRLVCVFVVWATVVADLAAQGDGAKVQSVSGALLIKQNGGWKFADAGTAVSPGQSVLALPDAELVSANGAVKLRLMADIGKRGPLPVLESVVGIEPKGDADLRFSLERGLVGITNQKAQGAAKVEVTILNEPLVLTLQEPGTKVGLEVYGRYAPGTDNFEVKGNEFKEKYPPNVEVVVLVTAGRVFLEHGTKGIAFRAPPGPAMARWNNLTRKLEVSRLEKLPDEITRSATDKETALLNEVVAACKSLKSKPLEAGIEELVNSSSPVQQRLGVTILGAVDNLRGLGRAINNPDRPEARDQAILVLRAWLGRAPGQATALYSHLTKVKGLAAVQARNLVRLLIGFDEDERAEPATYEALIELLNYPILGVRELAHWHLFRLAPAGRDIGFDAAAAEDIRRQAVARWRALIPAGQLPPAPKSP